MICACIIKYEQIKQVKRDKGFGSGRGVAKYSKEWVMRVGSSWGNWSKDLKMMKKLAKCLIGGRSF